MSSGKKIKTLERRRDHLAARMTEEDPGFSYDKAEHSALEWAIPILKEVAEEEAMEREAERLERRLAFGADPVGS